MYASSRDSVIAVSDAVRYSREPLHALRSAICASPGTRLTCALRPAAMRLRALRDRS